MRRQHVYPLQRQGDLWVTRAALHGTDGRVVVLKLLLDTGATFTIIPVEVAERLGCDLSHPLRRVRVASASGVIIAPMIPVARFDCLGTRFKNMPVIAFTLPAETFVDGLLGMDFLGRRPLLFHLSHGTVSRAHAAAPPHGPPTCNTQRCGLQV